jgi:hypothetical protein
VLTESTLTRRNIYGVIWLVIVFRVCYLQRSFTSILFIILQILLGCLAHLSGGVCCRNRRLSNLKNKSQLSRKANFACAWVEPRKCVIAIDAACTITLQYGLRPTVIMSVFGATALASYPVIGYYFYRLDTCDWHNTWIVINSLSTIKAA